MKAFSNVLCNTVRLILGIVFYFSAFLKGLELSATTLKITEYVNLIGISIPVYLAEITAISLILIEMTIGIAFLLNLYTTYVKWIALILGVSFLIVTSYMYYEESMDDCGCFGSQIVLNPLFSLIKNIILFILLIFLIIYKTYLKPHRKLTQNVVYICIAYILSFCLIMLLYPTIYDNSEYKVGYNITNFSNLYFTKPTITKDGIRNESYINPTEQFGNDTMIINIVEDIDPKKMETLALYYDRINRHHHTTRIKPILITSSSISKIIPYISEYNIFNLDNQTLKELLRTGFGILVINKGIIIGKLEINSLSPLLLPDSISEITRHSSPIISYIIISSMLFTLMAIIVSYYKRLI